MENDDIELLYKRPDGSFVAMLYGNPYHVQKGDEPLFTKAKAKAQKMGDALGFEPAPPEPQPSRIEG